MNGAWSAMKVIKGAGLLLAAGLLAWRALVTNLADYYAGQGTSEAAVGALRWRGDQPAALYQRGMALAASEPVESERLLRAAARADPTDALVYLALAELWVKAGRQVAAARLVEIADALGPLRSLALARSAEFWLGQERPDRALAHWRMLLRTRPGTAVHLFPLLLRLAEAPATQPLLQPLLADPPEWWDSFFAHAAAKAARPETVVSLYQNRNRRGTLPSVDEQRAYLDRLWKENRWLEAYLAWLNGLDERRTWALGNVYNGSFEAPVTHMGFDWRMSAPRGTTVETVETYGARGGKALHVGFSGERVHFQHVSQYLFLDAGRYRLQGRGRPDGLQAERGLRWRVRCVGAVGALLAESESFVGSDEWRSFAVDFTVPDRECPAQLLRLELDGRVDLDFEAQGGVWFDDLAVVRQN
ncbi:MAG: hypothetical protein P9F75_19920 [Candidatus Contendobacter sp.]|nr:hypothetical protein [Candidatus Contendobacter sp.]